MMMIVYISDSKKKKCYCIGNADISQYKTIYMKQYIIGSKNELDELTVSMYSILTDIKGVISYFLEYCFP